MSPSESALERLLLLGRDVSVYGEIETRASHGGRVALAGSVGGDPESPALAFKGSRDTPNEDAALALVDDARTLLAVADAHHGAHASHALLQALHDEADAIPGNPAALLRMLQALPYAVDPESPDSATSLLVLVHRAELHAGFGFAFGDATATLVGEGRDARPLHRPSAAFVVPGEPATLDSAAASFFEFDTRPGDLLVAFTDGVNECCYRRPERSPGDAERAALFDTTGADAGAYARALAELSLAGRPDAPGGQDNLAIAVAAV